MTSGGEVRSVLEKPLVYNTRPEGCQETGRAGVRSWNRPQPTAYKQISPRGRLTVLKSGTYTDSMTGRRVFPAAVALAALVIGAPALVVAQAIQRSMYVSVVDANGAPIPNIV